MLLQLHLMDFFAALFLLMDLDENERGQGRPLLTKGQLSEI